MRRQNQGQMPQTQASIAKSVTRLRAMSRTRKDKFVEKAGWPALSRSGAGWCDFISELEVPGPGGILPNCPPT